MRTPVNWRNRFARLEYLIGRRDVNELSIELVLFEGRLVGDTL